MNLMWWWCVAWALAWRAAACQFPAADGGGALYDVETTLELSALAGGGGSVGYRLRGALAVSAAWAGPERRHLLLAFRLQAAELQTRGAHARAEWVRRQSLWDEEDERLFYGEWRRGAVPRAFLDRAAAPHVRHYQRALLSLFQFHMEEGERNETDVSGDCLVAYETISPTVFRKIKRRCAWEEAAGAAAAAGARRVARYTLSEDRSELRALHSEEVAWVTAGGRAEGAAPDAVGVKARSWTTLAWRGASPAPASAPALDLDAALAALPAHLEPATLPLPPLDADEEEEEELEVVVLGARAALGGEAAGEGGGAEAAAALPALLRALGRADAPRLRALLVREDLQDVLSGLWHAVGLAGTAAGAAAARALLAPHAEDALVELTSRYLAGLALAPAPHEEAVRAALALGRGARVPAVREAAWLAAAAAASRLAAGAAAAPEVRDQLAAARARCVDAACRGARARALGNLRDAEALAAAAVAGAGEEATEALRALRRLPPRALPPARLDALASLATNGSRALVERALALEVVALAAAGGEAVPLRLVRAARALLAERGAAAHELRRALWQRLGSLAERPAVRALHRLLPADLASWDARAHAGKSSVLRRDTGWQWGRGRAQLDSVQVAARGLLRRGAVALLARGDTGAEDDLLTVEVATRGLEALAGGEEEEAPAAELHVTVAGAALPPVTLFSGQAELAGHVWAGRGAAPTPVVRALLAPAGGGWRGTLPLQAGVALAAACERGGALALDASADVSLWYRTARARLALRAAGAARAAARVSTPWASLRAEVRAAAAPRLRIAADVDFHSAEEVALCVRAQLPDHELTRLTSLTSAAGAQRHRVRRERTETLRRAGRTLALGRENDAACRVLRAADPPEDEL